MEGSRAKFLTQCPSCAAPLDGRFTPLPPNAYAGHSVPPPMPRASGGTSTAVWILGITLLVVTTALLGGAVLVMRSGAPAGLSLAGAADSSSLRDTVAVDAGIAAGSGFDKLGARDQIDAATDQIQSCAVPGAPRGTNAITIVFANTGKVSEVLFADGPLADPRVSTCIGDKYLKIKVAPFSGPPARISKAVTLR